MLTLSEARGGAILGLTNAVILLIYNDFSGGRLNYGAGNYSVAENGTTLTVTVNRTGGSQGELTVTNRTSDGTALAGVHYTGLTNVLSWANGENGGRSFVLNILDNADVDPGKQFGLQLSGHPKRVR